MSTNILGSAGKRLTGLRLAAQFGGLPGFGNNDRCDLCHSLLDSGQPAHASGSHPRAAILHLRVLLLLLNNIALPIMHVATSPTSRVWREFPRSCMRLAEVFVCWRASLAFEAEP